MLFITNRAIKEPLALQVGRKVTFDQENNQSGQSIYFCRRNEKDNYTEIGSSHLLEELRVSPVEQILVYIHGFNNQMEDDIFPRAQTPQALFDGAQPNLVHVLPLIWPCNDHVGVIRDYYYDEDGRRCQRLCLCQVIGSIHYLAGEKQYGRSSVLLETN